ncbi:MAG: helix-turn-helix transcriptional regulator [Edaphobacter sp.]|uniref:AraC family transcriptional regulator n=1 Tax=Edaphobacter sp. TaxID=1934404 RepID=UPI002394603F|nr:helix-turn-helix transcriptional regulator [Edaphobacter sp.]MDE1178227.1 helix-turn-helix transcriptional regulator [Edaphobacter sp.]
MDRPVAALSFDYAADDHVPIHEHVKAQLLYAIEGTMVLSTRQGKWVLLPTRALWVPANTRHSIRMRGPVRMRTLFFDHTVTAPTPSCAAVSVSPLLRELIVSMLQEPRWYAPASRGAQMAALISSELHVCHTLPLSLPWPGDAKLRRACDAMQRNPTLAGDMEYWASRLSMSSRTLARRFRAETGMSFREWRAQLLLLEAQLRLAQGQSSSRIANALGYASHAAFSAMFRKATGLTPSERIWSKRH